MREFLKGLGLEADTINSIMAEYGKNFSKLREDRDSLKEKLKESEGIDLEAIKKEQFDLGKSEANKELETFKKSIALERALANSKAKDTKLLEKLIDSDKLQYDEDNGEFKITGLEEQLKSIKETHSYLFEDKKPTDTGMNLGGGHQTTTPAETPSTLMEALHQKYDNK